jgi:sn-glycerol 3-phosphate transport system permease protein
MSADVHVLAAVTPGFRQFLIVLGVVLLGAIVLGVVGTHASPALARRAATINRYLLLTVVAVIILFPVYMVVVNSLLPADVIGDRPPTLWPSHPLWHTYGDAWSDGHISRYLFNSFFVTFIIVTGQVITAIFAGYAFAFLDFPLKRTIFVLFLTTMMIPFEVTFITNLQTISTFSRENVPVLEHLAGFDTYGGLAVPFLATGFGAFLIRQAFLSLPHDLRDAAQLDGYGHWRFMTRVAVPLARPSIAALALFSFFGAWNQYLWPLVATRDDRLRTVQVGIKQLIGTSVNNINVTFAGTVLAALPLFVLLVIFQKQLVRGLTAGAVKG